jgi:signal transduction histidine kinase
MNHNGFIQCSDVATASNEETEVTGTVAALRLELERSRRELEGALAAHEKSEALLQGEKQITELIAQGNTLDEILDRCCRLVEEVFAGSFGIIMLMDSNGKRLCRGAAPSFPAYMEEVDGFEINPRVGTCSAAAARGEPVVTTDIMVDPHWATCRDLAARHRLRAGWATPILSSAGRVLGTFALYWREPSSPTPQHLQIINQLAQLVAFAIERARAANALLASEKLARGQTEALTRVLDALARESDPERIVEHVLQTVISQLDAHSDSVWLRNETTGLMVFEFMLEDGKFKTKNDRVIAAVSPSLPVQARPEWQEIFRTGRPIVLEDIREMADFPWRARLLAQGIVTILVVPMIIAGKAEGVIGVRFTQKRTMRAEELDLAQALANQAMLAIQLARLSTKSRQSAIVEERNRMARDIHDTLAQGFTGVILHVEAAEEAMSRKRREAVIGHLHGAGEIARDGLREARRSVRALRPLALEDKKLAQALEELIMKLTVGTAVQATFTLQGEPRKLPPESETNFLRIGQEALTNAIRHARPGKIDVLLAFGECEVRLTMCDNGCGFEPDSKSSGFGLQGMAERAESMGGQFSIQSANGKGTIISVAIPLPVSTELEEL